MLEVLRKRQLTDTVAVVTRSFGGIRLGAGGLIRMYGAAVTAAVDAIGIVERRHLAIASIAINHVVAGRLEHALRSSEYIVEDVAYAGEGVVLVVSVPAENVRSLRDWVGNQSSGKASVTISGATYVDVPVDATS